MRSPNTITKSLEKLRKLSVVIIAASAMALALTPLAAYAAGPVFSDVTEAPAPSEAPEMMVLNDDGLTVYGEVTPEIEAVPIPANEELVDRSEYARAAGEIDLSGEEAEEAVLPTTGEQLPVGLMVLIAMTVLGAMFATFWGWQKYELKHHEHFEPCTEPTHT